MYHLVSVSSPVSWETQPGVLCDRSRIVSRSQGVLCSNTQTSNLQAIPNPLPAGWDLGCLLVEGDGKFYRWPSGCRSTLLPQSFLVSLLPYPDCSPGPGSRSLCTFCGTGVPFWDVLVISITCAWVKPSNCPSLLLLCYSTCRADPQCAFTVQERLSVQAPHNPEAPFGELRSPVRSESSLVRGTG